MQVPSNEHLTPVVVLKFVDKTSEIIGTKREGAVGERTKSSTGSVSLCRHYSLSGVTGELQSNKYACGKRETRRRSRSDTLQETVA